MKLRPEDLINAPLMAHARATLRNSQRWFPSPRRAIRDEPGEDDPSLRWQIEHQTFGISGEAGEIVEWVKKWHRDDFNTDELRELLRDELPDVLTYLFNLAALLNIDLDDELAAKQDECERRWGGDL